MKVKKLIVKELRVDGPDYGSTGLRTADHGRLTSDFPRPSTRFNDSTIQRFSASRAFTMIEIAISLAVIGFALVAIIGILPTGLDVQKQNREETIINQDAQMWMEAIRNGAQGMNDLTNYVDGISNYVRTFRGSGGGSYTFADRVDSYTAQSAPYAINNGYRIVGLLSTPKFTYDDRNLNFQNGDFTS